MSPLSSPAGATVAHVTSPARLLAPSRRTVPFLGRTAERASFAAWCEDPRPVSVRLVSGPRGVGKTRLAREVAHERAHAGWTCLDVPDGAEAAALAAVPDGAPALLLVDDAERRGPALADLLRTAARGRNGALRVLLVARDAGVWFDRLAATGPDVRALVGPARSDRALRPEVLPGQVDARLVTAFVEPYAQALGVPVPRVAVASVPGGARMLDLQAAALCAVLRSQTGPPAGVLPVDVSDALDELLEHERWSWFRSAEEEGVLGGTGFRPEAMDALVAAATLTGVRTQDAAENLVRRVAAVVPGVQDAGRAGVARWLLALDPARALPARLLDPHLLAELTDTPDLLAACLTGASPAAARRAALRMTAVAAERLDARCAEHGPALDRLGAAVAALPPEHDTLRAVSGAFPHPSLALGELRAELASRTLGALGAAPDGARLAEARHDAGVALREAGRAEDAEPHERRAVSQFQRLAGADPRRFRPRLAVQLAHLAATCAEQGRYEEARDLAGQAVALLRLLAAGDATGAAWPELATALTDLAATAAALGDPAAALAPGREAVEVWRRLVQEHPERFVPGLARALAGVARWLVDLGRAAEAIGPAAESLGLSRDLAATDPDAHLPGLGDALSVTGSALVEQGDDEEAVPYLTEAVATHRRTAEENPGRYLPDLARSLQALGTTLAARGETREGVALQLEAVEVRRRLVAGDRDRHLPGLAGALSGVGATYSRLDRPLAALDAEREATRAWRELAARDPERYRPRLARSLTTVSASFAALRLGDEAVAPASEAVVLLRDLAGGPGPDAERHRAPLAEALRALALALHDQERFGEAQEVRGEAEDLGTPMVRRGN
ncbi:tetratricopeptide repeat protein [Promicromonospora sp. MS192]|uniref:tetratricopeptide repeat protein n=1 Tax=Promicromonospora sp. MS192 TaxID=3412684 RepID=UPI003C2B0B3E